MNLRGWQRLVFEALVELGGPGQPGWPARPRVVRRRELVEAQRLWPLGEGVRHPAQAVSLALQRLRDKGLVEFVGRGAYRLLPPGSTPAGRLTAQGVMMRSPLIEDWLKREGIPFHYEPVVPITRFDLQRSRDNQAREGGWKLPSMIERYALAMLDGREFPALIAHPGPEGLVLDDGNQRLSAALEIELAGFDCYVLDTTDQRQLDLVTLLANSILNGAGSSPEELLAAAKQYLLRYPSLSVKEVARLCNVKERVLLDSRRQDDVTVRLGKLGVNVVGIHPAVLGRMHAVGSDPVLREFGVLAGAAGLTSLDARALLAELRQHHSEAEQLRVIREFRERPDIKEKIRRRIRGLPKAREVRSLNLTRRLRELTALVRRYPTLEALEFVRPEQVAAFREQVQEFVAAVNSLFGAAGETQGREQTA